MVKRLKKRLTLPDLHVVYAGLGVRTPGIFTDLFIIACLMLIPEIFFPSISAISI